MLASLPEAIHAYCCVNHLDTPESVAVHGSVGVPGGDDGTVFIARSSPYRFGARAHTS